MSGSSAMRNAVKRVTHKERGQLFDRRRLGLLEKHKDYVERATDYKNKRNTIVSLKRKAAERNPDEFYFQMNSSKVTKGIHQNDTNRSIDEITLKRLKTQDMGYIAVKKSGDDSKIEQLKENLHLIGQPSLNTHKVFVDSTAEIANFDPLTHFGTEEAFVDRPFNRITTKQLEITTELNKNLTPKDIKKILKKNQHSYKELDARKQRAEKLKKAYFDLSIQRQLAGKGIKQKIVIKEDGRVVKSGPKSSEETIEQGDVVVYKWRRERAK